MKEYFVKIKFKNEEMLERVINEVKFDNKDKCLHFFKKKENGEALSTITVFVSEILYYIITEL